MNTELLGKVGKCFFLLVLFSCFTFLFGLPALSTFLQANVMTHTSVETFMVGAKRKALAPAITFCPRSRSTMKNKRSSGWKNTSAKDQHVLEYQCGTKEKTAENILECIKNKTFDLNETILSAEMGLSKQNNLLENSNWEWDVSNTDDGRCYTFDSSLWLEANIENGALFFKLNNSLDYIIHIHDPSFFLLTTNPLTIPKLKISLDPRNYGGSRFYYMNYIRLTKHVKMNQETSPCRAGSEYSFLKCLKTSVSNKVGCRQDWDRLTNKEIPKCKTADQLVANEAIFYRFGQMEQRELVETTKCALPCEYMEYEKQGEHFKHGQSFGLGVIFATTEVLIMEDILVYPFLSFMAEFGGALGLFLGFSLNMLWDFCNWTISATRVGIFK